MTKKKTTSPSTSTDALLAEIFQSPEYLAALKDRLIRGEAKAQEIAVARSLGLLIPRQDEDTEAREAMRRMDRPALRMLTDVIRLAHGPESIALRVIQVGTLVGIGFDTATTKAPTTLTGPYPVATVATVGEPPEPTDEALMPAAAPKTEP